MCGSSEKNCGWGRSSRVSRGLSLEVVVFYEAGSVLWDTGRSCPLTQELTDVP